MSPEIDLKFMMMAVEAAKAVPRENVHPNPRVGAVLVGVNGKHLVGAHERFGGDHAEVSVLKKCKQEGFSPEGATLYVTLEPCSHFGKTPPCVNAIIDSKIKKVVVGVVDSSKKVNGSGIEILKKAQIEVVTGVGASVAFELNKEWLLSHRQQRPFIRVKMGTSLDGLWTAQDGRSQWITGPAARAHAAELRSWADILVTSRSTVEKDNPRMTARINDQDLPLQPLVIVATAQKDFELSEYRLGKHPKGAQTYTLKDHSVDSLKIFLEELFLKNHCTHLLLEAGPQMTSAFLKAGLWDEIYHYLGATYLGGSGKRLEALGGGHLPGLPVLPFGAQPFEDTSLLLKFCNPLSFKNS